MLGSSRRGWRVLFGITMGVATAAMVFAGAPAASGSADAVVQPPGQIAVPTPADAPICEYTYRVVNQWQGGFLAEVTIRNISLAPVRVDRIYWTFTNGETINSIWNAVVTITGSTVTIRPSWTVILPPGGTVSLGFVGTGVPVRPDPVFLNGFRCSPL